MLELPVRRARCRREREPARGGVRVTAPAGAIERMVKAAEPFVGWRARELVNNVCVPLTLDDTWDRPTVYDAAFDCVEHRVKHAADYGWANVAPTDWRVRWMVRLAAAIADAAVSP